MPSIAQSMCHTTFSFHSHFSLSHLLQKLSMHINLITVITNFITSRWQKIIFTRCHPVLQGGFWEKVDEGKKMTWKKLKKVKKGPGNWSILGMSGFYHFRFLRWQFPWRLMNSFRSPLLPGSTIKSSSHQHFILSSLQHLIILGQQVFLPLVEIITITKLIIWILITEEIWKVALKTTEGWNPFHRSTATNYFNPNHP